MRGANARARLPPRGSQIGRAGGVVVTWANESRPADRLLGLSLTVVFQRGRAPASHRGGIRRPCADRLAQLPAPPGAGAGAHPGEVPGLHAVVAAAGGGCGRGDVPGVADRCRPAVAQHPAAPGGEGGRGRSSAAFRRLHEGLFRAYFADNRDITDRETLQALWHEAELPKQPLPASTTRRC